MQAGQRNNVIRRISRLLGSPGGDATDRELLQRYAADRDEDAFHALVKRHGPMVLGVCRRILGHDSDADDAFQVTFLILARKAGTVFWRVSVGSWLYGVAYRTARQVRTRAARRTRHEQGAAVLQPIAVVENPEARELCQVLDAELQRIPEKFRMPLLLCCLQDQTVDEAAQQLGWSFAMVKGRLQRGRELLRDRLRRRGITLSAGVLAGILAESVVRAAPPALIATTLQAATAGVGIPAAVAELVKGAMQAMFWTKMKWVLLVLLVVIVLLGGSATLFLRQETALGVPVPEDTKVAEPANGLLPLAIVESMQWPMPPQESWKVPLAAISRGPLQLPPAVPSAYEYPPAPKGDLLTRYVDPNAKYEVPTTDRPTLLYLLGPLRNTGERWCPAGLSRKGNQFTLELESWSDDANRRRNILAHDGYVLNLGQLQAGKYELHLDWKGYSYTFNRDKSSGLEHHLWNTYYKAKLTFEVAAAPTGRATTLQERDTVPLLHQAEFTKQIVPQPFITLYRQMPVYYQVHLLPVGNLDGVPKPGLRVGAFNLANWLNAKPVNLGDFAALCQGLQQPSQGSQTYGVILGPNGMVLRDVIWNQQKVTLRVEVWPPTKPGGTQSVLIANIGNTAFPPVRKTPYEVAVQWIYIGADGIDRTKSQQMQRSAINRETFLVKEN